MRMMDVTITNTWQTCLVSYGSDSIPRTSTQTGGNCTELQQACTDAGRYVVQFDGKHLDTMELLAIHLSCTVSLHTTDFTRMLRIKPTVVSFCGMCGKTDHCTHRLVFSCGGVKSPLDNYTQGAQVP